MPDATSASAGRVFISYRREETAYAAGWLFDRLVDHFGRSQIFKDVDSIELGDDFVSVITTAVASCDVLLAVIGHRWVTITDDLGGRRLDDPDDFVRLEIEAALARDIRVVPILVDGASMPHVDELPPGLADLTRRQALELSPSRFDFDTSRLLAALDHTVDEHETTVEEHGEISNGPGLASETASGGEHSLAAPRPSADRTNTFSWSPGSNRTLVLVTAAVILVAAAAVVVRLVGSPAPSNGPGTQTTTPTVVGNSAPVQTVGAVQTVGPVQTAARVSATAGSVVFSDDFTGQAAGWTDARDDPTNGFYVDGAYHVHAPPRDDGGGEWSSPREAPAVYPSGPANIRVEVDARRVLGAEPTQAYGVLCRVSGDNFYSFTAGTDGVAIEKYFDYPPFFKDLTPADIPQVDVDIDANNHLQGDCTTNGDGSSVDLVFTLNGTEVARQTDNQQPLPPAGVGFYAAMAPNTKSAIEAEFDNFVVTELIP
jgi:hypothetical protein